LPLQITQVLENELLERFDSILAALRKFEKSVAIHKANSQSEITKLRQREGEIYGVGASTKGNVLLQTLGPTSRNIVAIGDVNPKKFGLLTPGTNIPIISEELLVSTATKEAVFLVLPWHFKYPLMKSLKLKYPGRKFQLLFPLPKIEFVEIS
jgi:NDP-4-keto-2,6-dideoxyhexose 3-C-methyltransferase